VKNRLDDFSADGVVQGKTVTSGRPFPVGAYYGDIVSGFGEGIGEIANAQGEDAIIVAD
jgi:hypothetical protein